MVEDEKFAFNFSTSAGERDQDEPDRQDGEELHDGNGGREYEEVGYIEYDPAQELQYKRPVPMSCLI
jgi:hypothetical protein